LDVPVRPGDAGHDENDCSDEIDARDYRRVERLSMMGQLCRWSLVVCVSVGAGTNGHAFADGQASPFHVGVDVVALDVGVTNQAGAFVRDLTQRDFAVFENGLRQDITLFRASEVPLALTFLLDTSVSMGQSSQTAQAAAIGLVRELGPADLASVVTFDTELKMRQAFTNDRRLLERAIDQRASGAWTAFYDSLDAALWGIRARTSEASLTVHRRAIIVVTDGDDTSSVTGFDGVLETATRANAAIYIIGLFNRAVPETAKSREAQFELGRIAQQTGGRAFFPRRAGSLNSIYRAIRTELMNQYLVGYVPTDPRSDDGFRRITVRIERPGLIARTRAGYYAPRD
jgi:Ca-activated chloride channel family protein